MGYLATGQIFENMLQLKSFSLYFEGTMNRKWLLSYRNNDISYRDARALGACSRENFKMIDAVWCVLMHYFYGLSFKKYHYLLYKKIDYSYTPGYTLAMCYFAP